MRSPVSESRSQREETPRRREAILEAAAEEFGRHGYTRTTIASIAAHAGLSDAGVLHHFGTKQELFNAVIVWCRSPYEDLDPRNCASVRELFDLFTAAIRRASENPRAARFRVMLTGESRLEGGPAPDFAQQTLGQALTVMVPVIARGVAVGELMAGVDPRQIALEILAFNEGFREQWVTCPEDVDYAQVFELALDRLYAAIVRQT